MIDAISSLGSNNYSFPTSALSGASGASPASGAGGDDGCCCQCQGGQEDSVSLSPEAMEMMMMEQQAAASQGIAA